MDPDAYLDSLDEPRASDMRALDAMIRDAAPDWDRFVEGRIIGYGSFHYRYASGREGDTARLGLASNKRYISLYVNCTKDGAYLAETYVDRIPGASVGKSCVRFKRLDDLDREALRDLLTEAHGLPGAGEQT